MLIFNFLHLYNDNRQLVGTSPTFCVEPSARPETLMERDEPKQEGTWSLTLSLESCCFSGKRISMICRVLLLLRCSLTWWLPRLPCPSFPPWKIEKKLRSLCGGRRAHTWLAEHHPPFLIALLTLWSQSVMSGLSLMTKRIFFLGFHWRCWLKMAQKRAIRCSWRPEILYWRYWSVVETITIRLILFVKVKWNWLLPEAGENGPRPAAFVGVRSGTSISSETSFPVTQTLRLTGRLLCVDFTVSSCDDVSQTGPGAQGALQLPAAVPPSVPARGKTLHATSPLDFQPLTLPFSQHKDCQTENFSYLILRREGPVEEKAEAVTWSRLIGPVLRRTRHVHCRTCSPHGELKHVVVTARKHSRWTAWNADTHRRINQSFSFSLWGIHDVYLL